MARIQGFVKNRQGKGVEQILITFHGAEQQDSAEMETDEDGKFRTKTLKSGSYNWIADKGARRI
jgi:protocatechuate 3,4-dioxygenase beta subunit